MRLIIQLELNHLDVIIFNFQEPFKQRPGFGGQFIGHSFIKFLYLEFLTHSHAYKVFKEGAYEAYRLFPFPKQLLENVKGARTRLRTGLAEVYGNQP